MEQHTEQINTLLLKLENLLLRQQGFEAEINALKDEVRQLQQGKHQNQPNTQQTALPATNHPLFPPKNTAPTPAKMQQDFLQTTKQPHFSDKFKRANLSKSDFEKFIGENLISKIGILILVIGVAIGAKLAIDKGLVSPLTRIILGYLVGVALMGFAIKLKEKYTNFSAVLLSGSIAIMYFITYAAYSYYELIPQSLAFVLMVMFTSFTIVAAIKYNQQVIAHIGLVGAYCVPFLLSDGSGKVVILFSYMAIINLGILALAFKKTWKPLFYLSFACSWLIFLAWRIPLDQQLSYLKISLAFASIFFLTFYITNLAYKVIKKQQFETNDVILILLNSFIFYGIGYYTLQLSATGTTLLGLFTLANAIVHFLVSLLIYKRKLADKNLFYFTLALVITFITMAVPVQLNGNWVTLFWVVEATVLYYLGRTKQIEIYEKLAFPLIFLAGLSLLQDWALTSAVFNYNTVYVATKPFFNVDFLSACIFIASFTAMLMIKNKATAESKSALTTMTRQVLAYAIPGILIATVYYTFRIEIVHIFENLYESTKINTTPNGKSGNYVYDPDHVYFKTATVFIYSILFATALSYLNLKRFHQKGLAIANIAINLVVIVAFLTQGLYNLSELRETYLGNQGQYVWVGAQVSNTDYFQHGMMNIGIRYISFACFGLLIGTCYQLSKAEMFKFRFKTAFDYLLYLAVLWVLSSELLHLLELNGLRTGYKLGLSILWGVYALILIGLGIWKNKKYLRIGAIALFGITLIKLFFYDIASLDTISKTIVFVSLGVLLLLISFLYNKYKNLINDDVKTEN